MDVAVPYQVLEPTVNARCDMRIGKVDFVRYYYPERTAEEVPLFPVLDSDCLLPLSYLRACTIHQGNHLQLTADA